MKVYNTLILLGVFSLVSSCRWNSGNDKDTSETASLKAGVVDTVYDPGNGAILKIIGKKHDFGIVHKKDSLVLCADFQFENQGNAPLVIRKADVSCGCVVPEFPTDPVAPKGKGKIRVRINTKNLDGRFNKAIFIKSTAQNDIELLRVAGVVK